MRRLVPLLVVAAAAAAGGGYALASKDAQAHGSLRSQPLVEGCTSPGGSASRALIAMEAEALSWSPTTALRRCAAQRIATSRKP